MVALCFCFQQPLARLGAQVTGLDASQELINAAKWHAEQDPDVRGRINYICTTVEELCSDSNATRFDGVIASEVLEHVADHATFVSSCCKLVKVRMCRQLFRTFSLAAVRHWSHANEYCRFRSLLSLSERSLRMTYLREFVMCSNESS